ncbi:MAG: homoserine O-acetyltransferase [Calditrichia bacterium]
MRLSAENITLFTTENPLLMDCGSSLAPVSVTFETYGELNPEGTNAILICHALTGSAHAADDGSGPENARINRNPNGPGWWGNAIGKGRAFDPGKYFIISSNILGSCYGTTGPASTNEKTGGPYRMDFPQMTVRDMVRVENALLRRLGVNQLVTAAGGSLGGMQALEWAVMYPEMVQSIIPIATVARHTAWGIGLNEVARLAIMNDPAWEKGNYTEQPVQGLALARMAAMISYRTASSYEARFGRQQIADAEEIRARELFPATLPGFQIENYLRYQGQKLIKRFDANTYIYLTRAIDSHDLAENRAPLKDVLAAIKAQTLCIGISSDILYPPEEQRAITAAVPNGRYAEIKSVHGHDAFLIEYDQLNGLIGRFLAEI